MSGALLTTWILFICFGSIQSKQSCSIDTDCDYPYEICSGADLTCYKVFNSSDYANVTIYDAAGAPSGINTDNLLDNNEQTSVRLSRIIWYRFDFILNGKYWVHDLELQEATHGFMRNWMVDGIAVDTAGPVTKPYGTSIKLLNPGFPKRLTNVSFEILQQIDFDIVGFYIAGAYDTPLPTATPTDSPTEDTNAPSVAPSVAPTDSPSAAPTAYPTPDVCEEYVVRQPCCGHFGFETEDDKLNIRDPDLTTCERSVVTECCGTTQPWTVTGSTYGCDSHLVAKATSSLDEAFCVASYFDTSVNTTDDIVGVVIDGTNTVYEPSQLLCDCEWTVNECEGEDIAACGTTERWNAFWDLDCWGNETWPTDEDFTNESCWKSTLVDMPYMEHLLWEPCSVDAFIGSVTEIQSVPSEMIHGEDCTCEYAIRDCRVLEDQSKTQCDYTVDCAEEGQCNQELAVPCCGYESYEDGVYGGVTAELDENGYPIEPWGCNNDAEEVCPDIFEGTRVFTATSRVDWWYDLDQDAIVESCGCLYVTDECNLPTSSPTADPTTQPSQDPTPAPSSSEQDDANSLGISYITYALVLIILRLY